VSMSVALPDRRIRHAEGQDQAGTRRFAKNTPTFHKIDPQSKEGSRAEPVHGGTPEHWWAAVGALKQQCSTPGMLCVASAKIRRLSLKRHGWEGSWAFFPSFLFFFSIFRFLFPLYFFLFLYFFLVSFLFLVSFCLFISTFSVFLFLFIFSSCFYFLYIFAIFSFIFSFFLFYSSFFFVLFFLCHFYFSFLFIHFFFTFHFHFLYSLILNIFPSINIFIVRDEI
jgi:hypothetical protein